VILLDTCSMLWLAAAQDQLSARARELLRQEGVLLFVSAISAFEIGIKHRKNALTLPLEPEAWYQRALDFHGLHEIPVTGSIACRSTQLPEHHKDPCDRIIVATAQIQELTVLTPDPLIHEYTEVQTDW